MRIAPFMLAALALGSAGCVRSFATGALADALSGSGGSYGQDEDPELVGAAVPFGLKTMEGVLVEQPEHRGLLLALCSGFVQYAYVWVAEEADRVEEKDVDEAKRMRARAQRLFARARGYGLRGLEVEHPGLTAALAADPAGALAETNAEDVPYLYWVAAAIALNAGAAKDVPEALAELPLAERLARRALELDEAWNRGSLHEFFVSYEATAPTGKADAARAHFARAVELSGGLRAGPYVALAEGLAVKAQDSREFHRLLAKALAIDVDASPPDRLANVIMQRKARRLEQGSGDLFLEDLRDEQTSTSTGAGS